MEHRGEDPNAVCWRLNGLNKKQKSRIEKVQMRKIKESREIRTEQRINQHDRTYANNSTKREARHKKNLLK